jgi:hypothetical protein
MVSLAGFELKFSRALGLVDQLDREIGAYLESAPFELAEGIDQDSGDLRVTVDIRSAPPPEWSLVVGDALHNARSALDHFAWQLVDMHGGPVERSRFPFKDEPGGFGDELRRALPKVPVQVREQVKLLQPWRGGDEKLWMLHHLDIVDKHRLLVPVGAATRGILLHFQAAWPGQPSMELNPIEILSKDRRIALVDGAEVFRDKRPAHQRAQDAEGPLRTRYSVTFEIVFATGSAAAGDPVGATTRELVQHAKASVEPLVQVVRAGLP